jgi:hypothetical protein
MGYFRRTEEEKYLAAVATAIDFEARRFFENGLGARDPGDAISTSLARVVFLRGLAEHIRQYKPSWVATRWISGMDKGAVKTAHQALWAVIEVNDLDSDAIIRTAQDKCDQLLSQIGSDKYLSFERGHPEVQAVRIRAVNAVNPEWEQAAYENAFERLMDETQE